MMSSEGCQVLILASSADPDEMQHYHAAFHLESSLFAKVPVQGFPVNKWLMATEKCPDDSNQVCKINYLSDRHN